MKKFSAATVDSLEKRAAGLRFKPGGSNVRSKSIENLKQFARGRVKKLKKEVDGLWGGRLRVQPLRRTV